MNHHGKQNKNHVLKIWWSKDEDSTDTSAAWQMAVPGLPNNIAGNLKKKKIISGALVDQATDEIKSSGPNHIKWIALARGHHTV